MIKQSPSLGRIVAMVAFAVSCVGILLYLWLTFGGSIPLRAEGYRFAVQFPEATQLAQEADVRISGVNVGKVRAKTADRHTGLTKATLELDSEFAPIPANTRAILRQKTLLGETYVELSPGNRDGPKLADGATLARGQVSPTVELDEIFRTFDPKTREAFKTWLADQGRGIDGRGQALNAALGQLTPFARDTDDVLRLLHRQSGATSGLVRDTGTVFDALGERRGQLAALVRNSNRVFATTAARDRRLQEAFVVLPTFLREARATTTRLTAYARHTNPLVTQLRPAARELSPAVINLNRLAPDLRGLFRDFGPLIRLSRPGLPALEKVLDDTQPLMQATGPYLRQLQPVTDYLGLYRQEITAFLANAAAATQASDRPPDGGERLIPYLRVMNPLNPEMLAAYQRRLPTNRSNAYTEPGGYRRLGQGLATFGSYLCQNPAPATPQPFQPKFAPGVANDPRETALVQEYAFTPTGPTAPACTEQAPLGRLIGKPTQRFPRLEAIPAPKR